MGKWTVRIIVAATALAVVAILASLPPRTRVTRSEAPLPESPHAPRTVRGAFHIHTTRSDGALDKASAAAAAARAGLQFAVFTEHGDGTEPVDPPVYIDGVLCLEGVEISTNGGHYIALGLGAPAPYPLGGEADTVVEDVARLGGFGIVAHPFSARGELAWADWNAPMDGLELFNLDSEWRDETRLHLSRAVFGYLWRASGALLTLLDAPVPVLRRWDEMTARRRVVGLAGHDAHGGFGAETGGARGRRVHAPSYEAAFETFSIHVAVDEMDRSNPGRAGAALLRSLRDGRAFTAIDALAAPAGLAFIARAGERSAGIGEVIAPSAGPIRFSVRSLVPDGATTVLVRNGRPVARSPGGILDHESSESGAYRVEIHVDAAPGSPPVPWLISNPIYVADLPGPSTDMAPAPAAGPASWTFDGPWRTEASPGSTAAAAAQGAGVSLTFALAGGSPASQFAALVGDLAAVPDDAEAIVLRGRASRPMRVSVQLRFPGDGQARWIRSVYLDQSERELVIPLDRLRPADASGPRPPLSRSGSLLFVVDLTNAKPGAEGEFEVREVGVRGKS